jgi:hypothetical protein
MLNCKLEKIKFKNNFQNIFQAQKSTKSHYLFAEAAS